MVSNTKRLLKDGETLPSGSGAHQDSASASGPRALTPFKPVSVLVWEGAFCPPQAKILFPCTITEM